MSFKRVRSENFTPQEKDQLLSVIFRFRHIVTDKKTDNATKEKKDLAWQRIQELFNSKTRTNRSAETLKTCWGNMKRRCRKTDPAFKAGLLENRVETESETEKTLRLKVRNILNDSSNNIEDSLENSGTELSIYTKEETHLSEAENDDEFTEFLSTLENGQKKAPLVLNVYAANKINNKCNSELVSDSEKESIYDLENESMEMDYKESTDHSETLPVSQKQPKMTTSEVLKVCNIVENVELNPESNYPKSNSRNQRKDEIKLSQRITKSNSDLFWEEKRKYLRLATQQLEADEKRKMQLHKLQLIEQKLKIEMLQVQLAEMKNKLFKI